MTFDERVHAVAKKGFTQRQARFLAIVMLHAGVCVPRQYARFCSIVHGQKTRKFFAKLVRLQYASMYDCRHNRARIYHVNQRALYAAIGEADSKLRRPLTLNHAIQRLMVVDAIVEDPEMIWLGTAEDKANHLTALTGITPEDLPHVTVGDGERRRARYFPDRLPIGIHLAGRGVLAYVVLDPTLNDFRLFLERHSAVLRALPAWTVRVVVPPQFSDLAQRVKQAFFTQLAIPALSLEAVTAVRQRFESVRTQHYPFDFGPTDHYVENRDSLAAPKYHMLFKLWKKEGDAALASLASSAIHDAVQTGAGRIETLELGHRYGHLSPLAAIA
ncbi:MAG: hypothetical protein H0X67_18185 [Acidobacteria bacterium]|nr:hypothetical protein [Acidobacteriota bacterium]